MDKTEALERKSTPENTLTAKGHTGLESIDHHHLRGSAGERGGAAEFQM